MFTSSRLINAFSTEAGSSSRHSTQYKALIGSKEHLQKNNTVAAEASSNPWSRLLGASPNELQGKQWDMTRILGHEVASRKRHVTNLFLLLPKSLNQKKVMFGHTQQVHVTSELAKQSDATRLLWQQLRVVARKVSVGQGDHVGSPCKWTPFLHDPHQETTHWQATHNYVLTGIRWPAALCWYRITYFLLC